MVGRNILRIQSHFSSSPWGEGFIPSPTPPRWLGPPRCWRAGVNHSHFWRSYSVQDASKSGQDASKSAIIASKMPPRGSKSSQVASKSSKMPPRPRLGPEKPSKNIKKQRKTSKNQWNSTSQPHAAKSCQDASKTALGALQMAPTWPPELPRRLQDGPGSLQDAS